MGGAHRIQHREPVPGGHLVIDFAIQKPARRDMRSPWPPAWPWQVDRELGLLREFVVIVAAHAGDPPAMEAAFASVLLREEAREQGRLSVADRRRQGKPIYAMTDDLRALFARPDPVRALIGGPGEDGWVVGLAGLTPVEQKAYSYHLDGLSRTAIALSMASPGAQRFGRAGALPLKTISQYLWRSRVKLRAAFTLSVEQEELFLADLDGEEAEAARRRRPVDPAGASNRSAFADESGRLAL